MRLFLILFSILALGSSIHSRTICDTIPGAITSRALVEPRTRLYFENLKWQDSLSHQDITTISTALDSSYAYEFSEPVLIIPLLVHREYSILNHKDLRQWEVYRKYFYQSINLSDQEYDHFLFDHIEISKLDKFVNSSDYHAVSDDLLYALVIRQSKKLRKGLSPNVEIPDSLLNHYQKSLLFYSGIPDCLAMEALIFEILHPGKILTDFQYASLNSLYSYGVEATDKMLAIIMDSQNVKSLEEFGKKLLLNFVLTKLLTDVTKEEQNKVLKYLNQKKIYDGLFHDQKSSIAFTNSMFTGKILETCMNEIGIYYDTLANRKMMERIVKQMKEDDEKRRQSNPK
ncbi:MAG: hypothetical protein WBP41_19830 [Saprospiraceae bacterium]